MSWTNSWMFDEETLQHLLPQFQVGWNDLSHLMDLPSYPLGKGFTAYRGKYYVRIDWPKVFPELPRGTGGAMFKTGYCICESRYGGGKIRNDDCLQCNVSQIRNAPWQRLCHEQFQLDWTVKYSWGERRKLEGRTVRYYSTPTGWLPLKEHASHFLYDGGFTTAQKTQQISITEDYQDWINALFLAGQIPLPIGFQGNRFVKSKVLESLNLQFLRDYYLVTKTYRGRGGGDADTAVAFSWYNPHSDHYYKIEANTSGEPRFGFYRFDTKQDWIGGFLGTLTKILLMSKTTIKALNYP